jgi:hypothetical protein
VTDAHLTDGLLLVLVDLLDTTTRLLRNLASERCQDEAARLTRLASLGKQLSDAVLEHWTAQALTPQPPEPWDDPGDSADDIPW